MKNVHCLPLRFFSTKKSLNCIDNKTSQACKINVDYYLREAINHLRDDWYNPKVGLVSCALVDEKQGVVYGTTRLKDGFWLHAEQYAYEQFIKKFKMSPSPNTFMIVTLSPCIKPLEFNRQIPCMKFIQQKKIKRLHMGKLDVFHADSLENYQQAGLVATITQDEHLLNLCDRFYSIIKKHGDISPQELTAVKRSIGDSIFMPEQSMIAKVN